ncbi:MAG: pyrroloquinoline quinone biosynthesis peptide chaperone PqqD [Pseudomonadota bacterium]
MTAAASPPTTPVLPRGVRLHWDAVRKTNILLGPERALMLDQIAHEILKRVDGAATEAEICDDLAATFGAPLDQIAKDVDVFLADLADRRLLERRPG